MAYVEPLTNVLAEHLPWHRARLSFIARFTVALLKLTTTNLAKLALALKPTVKTASNYRRIQRFMAAFSFDFAAFARLLLGLLPQQSGHIVVIDRTEWHFGQEPVNVLMIGIAFKGIAFPIRWQVLAKAGSSSAEEGMTLLRQVLRLVPPEDIRAVLADREFISTSWLELLDEHDIPFVIRLRKRRLLALEGPDGPALPAELFFRTLGVGQTRVLEGRFVGTIAVSVVGKRIAEDEYVILATTVAPEEALGLYRRRWEIETLFAALKSRGFDLEATHLSHPERIAKLIGLLALAFVWSHLIGQWRSAREGPPAMKKHGYRAKSLFRYGLDYLQMTVLHLYERRAAFERCIRAIAQPSQFLSCS
jgi:hypothetical protein